MFLSSKRGPSKTSPGVPNRDSRYSRVLKSLCWNMQRFCTHRSWRLHLARSRSFARFRAARCPPSLRSRTDAGVFPGGWAPGGAQDEVPGRSLKGLGCGTDLLRQTSVRRSDDEKSRNMRNGSMNWTRSADSSMFILVNEILDSFGTMQLPCGTM